MIDIAIPKGSLQNQTLQLFEQAGLEVKRTEREYNARIEDPRIGKVKILRPQEIPICGQRLLRPGHLRNGLDNGVRCRSDQCG